MPKALPWSSGAQGAKYAAELRAERARKAAYGSMMTIGEDVNRLIVHAKASQQPLALSADVLAKLVETQEAVFAAMRLMEKELS
jgi:hypothetical protein